MEWDLGKVLWSLEGWEDVEPIIKSGDLMTPMKVIYDSLVQTGFELVADGLVSDIIRRIAVFGMTLVPLDIREESTRHTLALDAITRHLGIGSYKVRSFLRIYICMSII